METWIAALQGMDSQIWLSLLPAITAALYFLGGLAIYSIRYAVHGEYTDTELATRTSSKVLGRWIRMYWAWIINPLWLLVRRSDIPANVLTTLALLIAGAAGVLLSSGYIAFGGWLFILTGVLDFLDGRVARARGEAGPRGAALDSVLDRFADAFIWLGLAWFYRETWMLLPVLFAFLGTIAISYVRARGEGLGVKIEVGLMRRPERVALLGAALIGTPLLDLYFHASFPHAALGIAVIFMAIMTNITAMQRLTHLLRALDDKERPTFKWRSLIQRGSASRSMIAALIATAADFAVVLFLINTLEMNLWMATALGSILGGILNFSIGRFWAFHAKGKTTTQAKRYLFVSGSSAALNSAGVAILALTLWDYRLVWLITRAAVFLAWNHPLQRDFVFNAEKSQLPETLPTTNERDEDRFETGNIRGIRH